MRHGSKAIAIFTGPAWQRWSPLDIETKGLGGSETAAVRLAGELAELGYGVTVYGDVEPCADRGVAYRHHSTFDPVETRDVLISSRLAKVFDRPVGARRTILWVHDVDVADGLSEGRSRRIHTILCLSRWHEQRLAGAHPDQAHKLVRIRNGVHHAYFAPQPWAERAQRVLYTSSPDRGLDVLLELWPRVREQVPDAELAHACVDIYDGVAGHDEQPGVVGLGSLSQPELAALMCSSRVWAHPSWMGPHEAPFHETSCLGAMEAQAAGCHVVASGWGALPETVRWGRLVEEEPLSDRWREAFVAHIVEGLTDPEAGEAAVTRGPAAVADLSWSGVAERVDAVLRAPPRPRGAPALGVRADPATAARGPSESVIPRTIHQIWLGPHEPPDAIETWPAAHPGWEHRLWTEADIPHPLVNQAQFEAMGQLCGKADILRYELLYRYGGVYVDADTECLLPLPDWLLADPCFAVYESEDYRPGLVANAVIGAQPGHPLMAAMLLMIGRLDPDELPGSVAAVTTGPYPFTRVVEANPGLVRIHPSGLFHPDH